MSTRPNPLATYSPQVDVWAVGVLVWEALAGAAPFAHEDTQQTVHNIQYAPLAAFPEGMSAACRDFVRRVRGMTHKHALSSTADCIMCMYVQLAECHAASCRR